MDSNILANFEKHVFYHGTSSEAVEFIALYGFRVWFADDKFGQYASHYGFTWEKEFSRDEDG